MLSTKFRFILVKRFQRRRFLKSTNQKQELHVAAKLINESARNEQYLQKTFHRFFLPSFGLFGHAVSRFFRNRLIRNKNCLWRPCLLNGLGRNEQPLQRTLHRCFLPIRVITKLPNSEQSLKGKVKTHNYINRQNQSTTGKL